MQAGDTLGSYEILGRLGSGGMGVVWLARDRRLGRKVALKALPPEVASDPVRKRRLETEARAVAALNHPGVVTLYAVEHDGDTTFLTMEYVEGRTLDARIPESGMGIAEFFDLALPLAEALAAAHRAGVIHRDLKPANVLVTPEGRVKVLDFGLARIADAVTDDDDEATQTRSGVVAGTVPYMSPEQLRGRGPDARADLFSLGVLYHEMLSGRRPFDAPSSAELISQILRDPVAPIARADVPPPVVRLVERCLEKLPENRPASADEVVRVIGEARSRFVAGQIAAPTPRERPVESERRTVAVLGFSNLAGGDGLDWLAAGIAETLTVDLKRIPGLRVVPETGTDPADRRVSGAFQAIGPAVRITARVVGASGEEAGALKLDGRMDEIFELQDRLAAGIADLLAARPVVAPSRASGGTLEAFECFARARVEMARMNPQAFARARELLARAVEVDPHYALARAGLGQLHALSYIGSTDPRDLERAIEQLGRATELDGTLGAAYQWLSYALMRAGRLGEAVAAGRHAIEVEPEGSLSHYFLGTALWSVDGREPSADRWPEILACFAESARLAPRYQAAHQLHGAAAMARGRYAEARTALERAAEIETSDDYELNRFLGAHAMLARLALREGRIDDALASAERAREICEARVHFYTPVMLGLADGVTADALFRRRQHVEALAHLRRAVERIDAHPRALSAGNVLVRTRFALARCFGALGMRSEALALYEDASDLLRTRAGFDFSWTAELTEADLHYETALCHAAAGHGDEAIAALRTAIDHGWGDRPALTLEPLFAPLASRPDWPSL